MSKLFHYELMYDIYYLMPVLEREKRLDVRNTRKRATLGTRLGDSVNFHEDASASSPCYR